MWLVLYYRKWSIIYVVLHCVLFSTFLDLATMWWWGVPTVQMHLSVNEILDSLDEIISIENGPPLQLLFPTLKTPSLPSFMATMNCWLKYEGELEEILLTLIESLWPLQELEINLLALSCLSLNKLLVWLHLPIRIS